MTAGQRGRSVLVLERNAAIGEKIRISGGGRCNFTNIHASHENFLSSNPHFCKSALARFTPDDFIALIEKHGIAWHEKTLGQLFCNGSSTQIISLLQGECTRADVHILTSCKVLNVNAGERYRVETSKGEFESRTLVVATGGLSIPKLGATDFGLRLAGQFGVPVTAVKPGLVPFTLDGDEKNFVSDLSGVSVNALVGCNGHFFRENFLFTHHGLSGPAILQASSYWNPGDAISINLSPDTDLLEFFKSKQRSSVELITALSEVIPRRLAKSWCALNLTSMPLHHFSVRKLETISAALHNWRLTPQGTEGFSKAEVTVGGVDTRALSSKTMEATSVPGLFFIGEVVDVTGHLGGYNFQWAWASGYAAGMAL
jgi:predicted Rossmann fold flavoprotein